MSSLYPYRLGAIALLFLLGSNPGLTATSTSADPTALGDSWEVSSRMSMEGMSMELPAQTAKVCARKDWTEPPGSSNTQHNCTNSDFAREGEKVTWEVSCEGPAMTGHGEITFQSADAYSGSIMFTSAQGNMTILLNGHRVGECDNPQ